MSKWCVQNITHANMLTRIDETYVGTYFLAEKHNCHLHRTTYSISNDTCLLGIQVKIWKYSEILEAMIVGKKMNADNNTRNIILISVSCLMSLEVQSGKNLPSSQKLQLWTSKDIKPLTEIKIIFLVLLSAFIFFTNDERFKYFWAFSYFNLDT